MDIAFHEAQYRRDPRDDFIAKSRIAYFGVSGSGHPTSGLSVNSFTPLSISTINSMNCFMIRRQFFPGCLYLVISIRDMMIRLVSGIRAAVMETVFSLFCLSMNLSMCIPGSGEFISAKFRSFRHILRVSIMNEFAPIFRSFYFSPGIPGKSFKLRVDSGYHLFSSTTATAVPVFSKRI